MLCRYVGSSRYSNQGQRVVAGQRLMQAASDIFLGWQRVATGADNGHRDFYVRQLRDWKFSLDVEAMVPRGLRIYGQLCGWTLARAHARSGDRIAIAAYLGGGGPQPPAAADPAAAGPADAGPVGTQLTHLDRSSARMYSITESLQPSMFIHFP